MIEEPHPLLMWNNNCTLQRCMQASATCSTNCIIHCFHYLYINAHTMGNKQEELEICVWSQGYDLIAITETWWDISYDWNAIVEDYNLLRKDRPRRQGGWVALYVREQLEYIKFCLRMDEKQAESLQVRINSQAAMAVVGVCYRPLDKEDDVDEAFYIQLEVASPS